MSAAPTIVLMHGLAIMRRADTMFTGVEEALQAAGHRTARTLVQGDGTLAEIAQRHWAQLETLDGPLVLLCHSMGGLAARTFLLDERKAQRLQAIATVGSPHKGSLLAWPMVPFNRAYRDLTPRARHQWETTHGATEERIARTLGIRRLSVCAALTRPARFPQLLPTQGLLQLSGGANDGLVSAHSQRWGDAAFDVDMDHVACVCVRRGAPRFDEAVQLWVRLADLAAGRSASGRPRVG